MQGVQNKTNAEKVASLKAAKATIKRVVAECGGEATHPQAVALLTKAVGDRLETEKKKGRPKRRSEEPLAC